MGFDVGVAAAVVRDNHVLLVQEARGTYKGRWGLPKGYVDPGESIPIINFVEKNNIKLKYILNTHHHYDHIGGNLELKEKYESKIVAFKDDKSRIPEIDVLVQNNQIWKADNFEAKIYHTPGHTNGHIVFLSLIHI